MLNLGEKFRKLDLCLTQSKTFIENQFDEVSSRVDEIFSNESQTSKINVKRIQKIAQLDSYEFENFNQLKTNATRCNLMHLKTLQSDLNDSMAAFIHNLTRLSYKNELKIFKKLLYYHIYNYAHLPSSHAHQFKGDILKLDMNKFIQIDENQIVLLNSSLKKLRSIQLKAGFGCYGKMLVKSKIFLVISKYNWTRTCMYVYDYDLNLLRKKFITNDFFIQFTQETFFYQNPATSNLVLCNLDLAPIQEIKIDLPVHIYYVSIISGHNRLVLSYSDEFRILTTSDFQLVKSVSTRGFSKTWAYVDSFSHIFLVMYDSCKGSYCVICLDVDGNELFKQRDVFSNVDDYSFDDHNYYVYNESNLLAIIF